jgi:hypothetical protein
MLKRLSLVTLLILCSYGYTSASSEEKNPSLQFANAMMICNSHALFQHMYAQGGDLPGVPKAANYKDLAYQAAGKTYVNERLESRGIRDLAVQQFEAEVNKKSFNSLNESEQEDHINATWATIIRRCNEVATAGKGIDKIKKQPAPSWQSPNTR